MSDSNKAEELLAQIVIEQEPEPVSEETRLRPDNIRDPSLTKDEIKRIILADTYYENIPTEDDGVYRRKKSIPLKNVIILGLIGLALVVALFYLASVLVNM